MYLLANGKLITRDPAMGYLPDGGIVIDGTKIKEVGTTAALHPAFVRAMRELLGDENVVLK